MLRGDVLDISRTGLRLCLDEALERGRELHLEFDLPTGRVEAVGEVRWVDDQDKSQDKAKARGKAEVRDKPKAQAEEGKKLDQVEHGIRFVRISSESLDVIARATSAR